jgi:KDO2-lipid IV(A) lauroyltransferase
MPAAIAWPSARSCPPKSAIGFEPQWQATIGGFTMRQHKLDHPVSYYMIFFVVRHLPVWLSHWLGVLWALMLYPFSQRERRGYAGNLSLALGYPAEGPTVRRLVRRIFRNYGHYLVDFFLMPQLPPGRAQRFFADIRGEHYLRQALAEGRGAILLTAHIGNWEFGGIHLRLKQYPLTIVTLPQNTSVVNALVNRMRQDKGMRIIELEGSTFSGVEILRSLRNNEVVAMIGDRDYFGRGRETRFFDRRVRFPVGPVVLAQRTGAALIPAFVIRRRDGRYMGILEAPLALRRSGGREEILAENLRRTARVFENYIRRYPDQWYCPDLIFTKHGP